MDLEEIWIKYTEERGLSGRFDNTYLNTLKGVFMSGARTGIKKATEEIRVIFVDNSLSCATLSQGKAEENFKDYKTIPLL